MTVILLMMTSYRPPNRTPPTDEISVLCDDYLGPNVQDWGWATRNLQSTNYTLNDSKYSISFEPDNYGAYFSTVKMFV